MGAYETPAFEESEPHDEDDPELEKDRTDDRDRKPRGSDEPDEEAAQALKG